MAMPRTRVRVVCTLCETMVTLAPTSALTSVDLPAFGAPMMATKPQRVVSSVKGRPPRRARRPNALAQQHGGRGRDLRLAFRRSLADSVLEAGMTTAMVKTGAWSGPVRLGPDRRGWQGPCPAPIPARRFSRVGDRREVRSAGRSSCARRRLPMPASRHRDRSRRSPPRTGPRARRRASPRPSGSRKARPSPLAEPRMAAISAQVSARTRSESRRDSAPSSSSGMAR